MKNKTDKLRLEKVDYTNFVSLCRLKVRRDQRNFVASNVFSIAEAYVADKAGGYPQPFGIFLGEKAIGFLMVGYYPDMEYALKWADEDEETPEFIGNSYLIWRFMIDKKYQHKGYGREAFKLVMDYVRTWPCGKAKYCWLSYEPENEVARKLYKSFGFVEAKEMPKGWDEIPAVLEL